MKTVTILMAIAIMILVVPMNSWAGTISAKNTDVVVSGYIGVDAPMHADEEYKVRWSRLRFEASSTEVNRLGVRFEYDLASSGVKYAYVKKCYQLFNGKVSATVGKHLSSAGFLMPGPNSILFGRWSGAFDDYGVYSIGVSVMFEKSNFTLRATHSDLSQASASLGFVSVMWQ